MTERRFPGVLSSILDRGMNKEELRASGRRWKLSSMLRKASATTTFPFLWARGPTRPIEALEKERRARTHGVYVRRTYSQFNLPIKTFHSKHPMRLHKGYARHAITSLIPVNGVPENDGENFNP